MRIIARPAGRALQSAGVRREARHRARRSRRKLILDRTHHVRRNGLRKTAPPPSIREADEICAIIFSTIRSMRGKIEQPGAAVPASLQTSKAPRSPHEPLARAAADAPRNQMVNAKSLNGNNASPMLLILDNYDSFTYNLVQYFGEMGVEPARQAQRRDHARRDRRATARAHLHLARARARRTRPASPMR